jgi:hypothetical protein
LLGADSTTTIVYPIFATVLSSIRWAMGFMLKTEENVLMVTGTREEIRIGQLAIRFLV